MRRFLVVLAVVVMGSLVPLARPASASSNLEAEFVALMNQERATRGLVTLATSGDLVNYGRTHSGSMASRNVLEHSTQLRTLTNWDMLGENVGRGGSVRALHDAFMNSPAHRDNILRSNYRETGVGVVVSGDTIWVTVVFRDPTVVVSTPPPAPTAAPNGVVGIVPTSTGKGYWLARTDGSVSRFGDAASLGSAKGKTSAPVVAMAATPTNKGYWLLDAAGGVFSFGDARYHGSVPGLRQAGHAIGQAEIRNIASTASGRGYWITDAAGGIFSFGDATFYGSIPGLRHKGHTIGQANVISMAPTSTGRGYWMLDAAGGMFSFGDARFYGSVPGLRQKGHNIGHASVISMAPTSTGRGYWMLDSVGGMFTFGDARFSGSVPSLVAAGKAPSASTASAMATHPKGDGYWILSTTGDVFGFGGAPDLGGL